MNALLEHLEQTYLPTVQVLWPVLLAAAGMALAGGTSGVLVVLRRQTLLALSLPQILTLGAAIGLRLGIPTLVAAIACLIVALVLVTHSARHRSTHLLLPALYVAGLCLSVLIVAGAGAELIHVQNLFIGIDVAVGEMQAVVAAGVLLLAGAAVALLWRRWLLLAQAPVAAELARLRPRRWDTLFLILLSIVLLVGADTLGVAMTVVMLFLPAAVVLPLAARVPQAIALACFAALLFLAMGLVLSIEMNWPLSHSVGGVGFGAYVVVQLALLIRGGYQKNH